jgi:uncharacterized phage-associated protein
MTLKREKLKSIVHYICHVADTPQLKEKFGATKLNKILWYADSFHYLQTGESLTGETYKKQKYGPVPQHILSILDELESCDFIKRGNSDYHGYNKRDFHCLEEPDISSIHKRERELLEELTQIICKKHTAVSISGLTHGRIWEIAREGEEIPLCATFVSKLKEPSAAAVEWATSAISKQQ